MKLILLAALIACLALLTASTFMTPVSNDAGAYLTIADGWMDGRLPYRDLFDHKTPGIYALYAVILAASGRSLEIVQLVQLAGQIACAGLVAWIAWRRWNKSAGALAGLLMLYGSAAFSGTHLTTEAWVALCIAAGLAALLWQKAGLPTRWQWFLAGLFVGLAALFKQTGLITLAAFAAWAWLQGRGWRTALRRWLWLAAGCALPIALTIAYFAANSALDDLWRDAVWVNLTSYPRLSLRTLLRGNFVNLRGFPLLWLALLLALVFARPRFRRSSLPDAATLLWLTLAAGLLPLLHRSYGHYVLQALPPAAILAGVGLASGWRWLGDRFSGRQATAVRAVVLVAVLALALIDLPRWPPYLAYTARLLHDQAQAAAAVQRMTQPGEPILVVSDSPQIYFLSNREPMNRWQYLLPVNHTSELEAELTAMITSRAARIVVTDNGDQQWYGNFVAAAEGTCTLLETFGDRFSIYDCDADARAPARSETGQS